MAIGDDVENLAVRRIVDLVDGLTVAPKAIPGSVVGMMVQIISTRRLPNTWSGSGSPGSGEVTML